MSAMRTIVVRLSLGLRKENGRWVVSHEHHSFPSP